MIPFEELFIHGGRYALPDGSEVRAVLLRVTAPYSESVMPDNDRVFICADEPVTSTCWYFYGSGKHPAYRVNDDQTVTQFDQASDEQGADALSVTDFRLVSD